MAPYLYLIVSGLLVVFASFAFVSYNLARHAKKFTQKVMKELEDPAPFSFSKGSLEKNPIAGFGDMFAKHLGAIIGMSFGGLVATLGVVLAICEYFKLL